jgi:hypothetical protein
MGISEIEIMKDTSLFSYATKVDLSNKYVETIILPKKGLYLEN